MPQWINYQAQKLALAIMPVVKEEIYTYAFEVSNEISVGNLPKRWKSELFSLLLLMAVFEPVVGNIVGLEYLRSLSVASLSWENVRRCCGFAYASRLVPSYTLACRACLHSEQQ